MINIHKNIEPKFAYSTLNTVKQSFDDEFKSVEKVEDPDGVSLKLTSSTNVVDKETTRRVQNNTLKQVKDYLSLTFGPMGSNTKIIKGNTKDTVQSSYSKDGLKVLKHIAFSDPIEASIVNELIDITSHVEKEVGDGTTSTVILSSLIFDKLIKIQDKYNIPPFQLINHFVKVVDGIKENIIENGHECDVQDIYDISMISTNGDVEVSKNIADTYEKYGMDVELNVGISNTSDSMIKVYDGLTITEGFADPAFVNNREENTCHIRDARIYHFADPIDTIGMVELFQNIIAMNIYEPLQNDEAPIPTVITCPKISKDTTALLKSLYEILYSYDKGNQSMNKPPILVITNVVASDEAIMDDIANICGCKSIRKYIDPKQLEKDQENGYAPTTETLQDFCGYAEEVVADAKKTKFINPLHMKEKNEETGEYEDDPIYRTMVNFLETEIKNVKPSDSAGEVGLLKRRLSALKANMVDYLVGGVTIAERDSKKDLIEDAIKNCKSAAKYGVGNAANLEALIGSIHYYENNELDEVGADIVKCIISAYYDISEILYSTVETDEDRINESINKSIIHKQAYDISSGYLPEEPSSKVKCSIMLDINILDTISKIITMMVTSNQCLLQAPQLNNY